MYHKTRTEGEQKWKMKKENGEIYKYGKNHVTKKKTLKNATPQ